MRYVCVALVFGLLCVACEEPKPDPLYEELIEKHNALPITEDLGAGDRILITVLHEEDLSGEFSVSPAGTISYPYVGRINVVGKTCLNIEDDITNALKNGYLAEPSVACSIVEYNSKQFFVFGEVKSPGAFPYKSNSTIIEAVAVAGGFGVRAEGNRARLNRVVDGVSVQVEVPVQDIIEGKKKNLTILPGDVIFVPKTPW